MQIKFHGDAPRGIPSRKEAPHAVLLRPGETIEVTKQWLDIWAKHPQIKALLQKGAHGGIEVVGDHDATLKALYGADALSSEVRLQTALEAAANKAEVERRRKLP
jgi:hypothetical protein